MTLANGLREPAQIGDLSSCGQYRLDAGTSRRWLCVGCCAKDEQSLCDRLWVEASCGVGVWHPITEQTEMELETKGDE